MDSASKEDKPSLSLPLFVNSRVFFYVNVLLYIHLSMNSGSAKRVAVVGAGVRYVNSSIIIVELFLSVYLLSLHINVVCD